MTSSAVTLQTTAGDATEPPARICAWCDRLDDPAHGRPCPCRAWNQETR